MDKNELFDAINVSLQHHRDEVKANLKKFEPIQKIIDEIKEDLKAGSLKPTKHTVYSSISNDYKIGITVYLKSGAHRISVQKSRLEDQYMAGRSPTPVEELMREVFTNRILGKKDKCNQGEHVNVNHALKRAGMDFDLYTWLSSHVSYEDIRTFCKDVIDDVKSRDLTNPKKKEIHTRKIALRRLKDWAERGISNYYSTYRHYNSNSTGGTKAKLPDKEVFIKIINLVKINDDLWGKRREIDAALSKIRGDRYSRSTGSFMGVSNEGELIFIQGIFWAAARHSGEFIDSKYQPTIEDVDDIYKYLIAKSIIEM